MLFNRNGIIIEDQLGIWVKTASSTKIHSGRLLLGEFEDIVICPIFYSVQVELELPFYGLHVFGPI